MKKVDQFAHGALFAIPLWYNFGFLYGKMLYGSELANKNVHPREKFIRVYDFYSVNLISQFEIDFFSERDAFVDTFILAGNPKVKGVNNWTFLRDEPVHNADEFIPHYWEPGMLGEKEIPDEKIFRIVKYGNLRNIEDVYFPYYRIRHLPIYRLRNDDAISLYLTFDWLRRNGKDLDEPFEYDDGVDVKKSIRFEVTHYTQDYRKIPKEIRGRVAPV